MFLLFDLMSYECFSPILSYRAREITPSMLCTLIVVDHIEFKQFQSPLTPSNQGRSCQSNGVVSETTSFQRRLASRDASSFMRQVLLEDIRRRKELYIWPER